MKFKIQKVLVFGISLCLLTLCILQIRANEVGYYPDSENDPFVQTYEVNDELRNYYQEKGSISLYRSENISITNVGNHTQKGNYDQLKYCDGSINDFGCAMVSFAMVAHKYKSTADVETVNNLGRSDSSCYFNFEGASSDLGLTFEAISTSVLGDDEAKEIILGILRDNIPVIVGMDSSKYGSHWVVVRGYNGDNDNYFIHDPASWFTILDDYFGEGYYINRIYTVTK